MIPLRDVNPSRTFPIITVILIVINVLVFLLEASKSPDELNRFIYEFGLVPGRFNLSIPELSTIMFSMFMHGGWMHLISNMWALWLFGDNIEDKCGHISYLFFYIACGIAAAMTQVMMSAGSDVPMVGASGAIAGVLGAYLVTFPHARVQGLVVLFGGFFTRVEVPAIVYLGIWIATQVFSGIGDLGALTNTAAEASKGGIAFFAHIGGFVMGIILIKVFGLKKETQAPGDFDRYY